MGPTKGYDSCGYVNRPLLQGYFSSLLFLAGVLYSGHGDDKHRVLVEDKGNARNHHSLFLYPPFLPLEFKVCIEDNFEAFLFLCFNISEIGIHL